MTPFKVGFNKSVIYTLCAMLVVRRRRRQRIYWIHPIISERFIKGKFELLHGPLKKYPDKFFEFYRLSVSSFEKLLSKIKVIITRKHTRLRDCIDAEEKLAVTLR